MTWTKISVQRTLHGPYEKRERKGKELQIDRMTCALRLVIKFNWLRISQGLFLWLI